MAGATAKDTRRAQGSESRLTVKFAEDYGEVVNAPAGLFASEFDGVLVANGSDKVESEMAHDGHVECAVAFSEPRLVVVEDDVEGPVQSVLDQPVAAHGMSGPFGRQLGGGDKISRVEAASILQSGARADAHDGCGVWQAQRASPAIPTLPSRRY